MGGDYAPEAAVKGAVMALDAIGSDSRIVLFGDEEKIKSVLASEGCPAERFGIVATTEVIEMGYYPAKAFQAKAGSEHHGRVWLPGQGSCRRFCERRFDRRHDGRFDVCRQTDRGCRASHDFIHRSHHRRASCAAAGRGPECGLQARGAGAVRPDRLDLRRGGAGHRASARGGAQHRRGGDQGQRPDQSHLRTAEGGEPDQFRGQCRGFLSLRARSPM